MPLVDLDPKDYDPTKAYIGVGPFKLDASHPFNFAAYIHDERYKTWPIKGTSPIDKEFLENCYKKIAELWEVNEIDIEEMRSLALQADACYKLCRAWGSMRYRYARLRGWNFVLSKEGE